MFAGGGVSVIGPEAVRRMSVAVCVSTGNHNDFVHCRAVLALLGVHYRAQAESVENNRMAGWVQSCRLENNVGARAGDVRPQNPPGSCLSNRCPCRGPKLSFSNHEGGIGRVKFPGSCLGIALSLVWIFSGSPGGGFFS